MISIVRTQKIIAGVLIMEKIRDDVARKHANSQNLLPKRNVWLATLVGLALIPFIPIHKIAKKVWGHLFLPRLCNYVYFYL